jgi:hypothetical protein
LHIVKHDGASHRIEGSDVSGLETAIRTALDNADRDNPEVRAKIYQSARQALEAGLRKQDITDTEAVAHHRHRLETTIHMIEAEERQRLHPRQAPPQALVLPVVEVSQAVPAPRAVDLPHAVEVPPVVEMPQPAPPRAREAFDGPSLSGETRVPDMALESDRFDDDSGLAGLHAGSADQLGAAPAASEGFVADRKPATADFRPERAVARRKPRKFFSRLLVWCVLLAFIGMGAWWAYTSGVLLTAAQRDTSVANPPATTTPEDFDGASEAPVIDPQNSFSAAWIEVFKPSDASKIVKGAQSRVENIAENDGPALRLTSQSNGERRQCRRQRSGRCAAAAGRQVLDHRHHPSIDIGRADADHRRMRFPVARRLRPSSLHGQPGKVGCAAAGPFDRSLAPNAAGTLLINSDVDGKARGINLYAVRILPGQ